MQGCIRRLLVFAFSLAVSGSPLYGQIHGVPASVTSFGFGGSSSFAPGVPASVTSLGPNGYGGHVRFNNCCFNAFGQIGVQNQIFIRGHHGRRSLLSGSAPIYVPYSVPYTQVVVVQPDADDEDDDAVAPTIFEHRRSRQSRSRPTVAEIAPEPTPETVAATAPAVTVIAQPSTMLVFRDGHQAELQNYAIVGDTIFDLSANRSHKILLADVDLTATRKANDARGVDFQVPGQ
jgi:hypothetical protein